MSYTTYSQTEIDAAELAFLEYRESVLTQKSAKKALKREVATDQLIAGMNKRAWSMGASGEIMPYEWREKLAAHGNCCAYCGRPEDITADHVVPLSKGGSNDISNIVPSCRSCNSKKGDKDIKDFVQA